MAVSFGLQKLNDSLNAADISVDFTTINSTMTSVHTVVTLSIDQGIIGLVAAAVAEMDNVNATLNETVTDSTVELKNQAKDVEDQIRNTMDDIRNSGVSSEIADAKKWVRLDIASRVPLGVLATTPGSIPGAFAGCAVAKWLRRSLRTFRAFTRGGQVRT